MAGLNFDVQTVNALAEQSIAEHSKMDVAISAKRKQTLKIVKAKALKVDFATGRLLRAERSLTQTMELLRAKEIQLQNSPSWAFNRLRLEWEGYLDAQRIDVPRLQNEKAEAMQFLKKCLKAVQAAKDSNVRALQPLLNGNKLLRTLRVSLHSLVDGTFDSDEREADAGMLISDSPIVLSDAAVSRPAGVDMEKEAVFYRLASAMDESLLSCSATRARAALRLRF